MSACRSLLSGRYFRLAGVVAGGKLVSHLRVHGILHVWGSASRGPCNPLFAACADLPQHDPVSETFVSCEHTSRTQLMGIACNGRGDPSAHFDMPQSIMPDQHGSWKLEAQKSQQPGVLTVDASRQP